MKTPVERISLRKRLALEVSRQVRENNKKLHPLRQLFWECTQRCNIHSLRQIKDCLQIDNLRTRLRNRRKRLRKKLEIPHVFFDIVMLHTLTIC